MTKFDENAIAKIAARQRGVVSVKQLHAVGFDNAAIKRRWRAGRLHRLHRGIYLVGHAVAPEGAAEVAALLACGSGSVVSHRSAARLWGLPAFLGWTKPVEVTVPGRDAGKKGGIAIYPVNSIDPRDVRRADGIPATTPARTLLDLSALLPIDTIEVAYADARARGLVNEADLADVLQRNPGRRGAKALRSLLALAVGGGVSRSEAERRMRGIMRTAALPAPKCNTRVAGFEEDFIWPEQRVIVEVDGFAFHADKRSFERDRERDARLAASGYVVIRVTWRQLVARREAVAARIPSQAERLQRICAPVAGPRTPGTMPRTRYG
jgi:very-short-patch-repair endonuclease